MHSVKTSRGAVAVSSLLLTLCLPLSAAPGELAGTSGGHALPGLATVYVNGDIITVNPEQPEAEAVAVREGRVLAVGSRTEVESAAGAGAKIRDLEGSTLMPGFIDSHGHLTYVNGLQLSANIASPPVGTARSIPDVLALLKAHRSKYPEAGWITGFGYDDSLLAEQRHPTREELDRVSTELPVAITHVSGHLMACNSRCLELSGIDADTVDPAGGHIRRKAGTSEPDGVLEETAMFTVMNVMPTLDPPAQVALLARTQRYYASYGITTVQEGAVTGEGWPCCSRRRIRANCSWMWCLIPSEC